MTQPPVSAPDAPPVYSPDGGWLWDGEHWTPVAEASHPVKPPAEETPRPVESGHPGPALALGIGAIVVGVAVWGFTFVAPVDRVDDIVVTVLVVGGFVAGEVAVVFGLRPALRPRPPGLIAAFTCGLVGMGILLLFLVNTLISY